MSSDQYLIVLFSLCGLLALACTLNPASCLCLAGAAIQYHGLFIYTDQHTGTYSQILEYHQTAHYNILVYDEFKCSSTQCMLIEKYSSHIELLQVVINECQWH